MKTRIWAIALVLMSLALASCTGFSIQEPQVPPVGDQGSTQPTAASSTVQVESPEVVVEKINLADGESQAVEAGWVAEGDVEVSTSSDGPWTPLHDDQADTGLIVAFTVPGWVRAPWGASLSQASVADLRAKMLETGCVGGCAEVVVVEWTGDGAQAASAVLPTSEPVPDPGSWVLSDPPAPEELPDILREEIVYQQPGSECSVANDPQVTCSTKIGQATVGSFTLAPGQGILMTGDAITIARRGEDRALAARPPSPDDGGVHDLWLVVNLTSEPMELRMHAPYGSFRGYFTAVPEWTPELASHLRDLHLNLFNLPTQDWERFYPTPVPNCGQPEGCPFVHVRLGIFWDGNVSQWFNGYWTEVGSPHWFPVSS